MSVKPDWEQPCISPWLLEVAVAMASTPASQQVILQQNNNKAAKPRFVPQCWGTMVGERGTHELNRKLVIKPVCVFEEQPRQCLADLPISSAELREQSVIFCLLKMKT